MIGRVTLTPPMARMLVASLPDGEARGDVGTVVALIRRGLVLAGNTNPLTEMGRRMAELARDTSSLVAWYSYGTGTRALIVPMEDSAS